MAKQVINNGDTGLNARTKLNENFTELYDREEFTAADRTKLDGIEALAEVNNISDANATALTGGGETALHKHDLLVEQNASLDTKIWRGTQAQYDALGTPDANTLYFITA